MSDQKQLSATLEEISVAARASCWESVRRGEGGGGREVANYGAGRGGPRDTGTETGDTRVGE